jgi:hypothetical protein
MPIFKKNNQDKLIKKNQELTSGISCVSGIVETDDISSSDWSELLKDYETIYNTDSVAKTSLEMIRFPLEQSEYSIVSKTNSDKSLECKEYLEYTFQNMIDGFQYFKSHCFDALHLGCKFFEIVFSSEKYNKKFVNKIIRLLPIKSSTLYRIWYDEKMDFSGIQQERIGLDNNISYIDIPKEQLFYVTHNMRDNDIRGNSELRAVRIDCKIKSKVKMSTGRGIERGAGIPIGEYNGNSINPDWKTLLRNIANSTGAYALVPQDQLKIRFEELKNQQNSVPFLEYLNREIFFNTLTQFLTSGIGQNGSRASTSELKSPYEIKISAIQQEMESYFNWLCQIAINNSYFANMPNEDRPIFKFGAIKQSDVSKAVENIKKMAEVGLILNDKDWNYIREMLGLNSNVVNPEIENPDNIDSNTETKPEIKLEKKQTPINFELENATKTFDQVQKESEIIINEVYQKMLNDIRSQYKLNRNPDFEVRYKSEMITRLSKQYNNAFKEGRGDVRKELLKLNNKVTLATEPVDQEKLNKFLERYTVKFTIDIKTAIGNRLERESKLKVKTDEDQLWDGFQDWFKEDKRNLITASQLGYTEGRNFEFDKIDSLVDEYVYTAVMDTNTCNECAKYDGIFVKSQDRFPLPNIECLGKYHIGNACRCQWAVSSLKTKVLQ